MPPARSTVGGFAWEGDAMRKAFSIALVAAMVCLVAVTKDAGATVTFSLEWVATTGIGFTGTNVITALPGDVLTLAIRMTTDQTLGGHSVSLDFDVDLGNELNLLNPNGGKNWSGTTYGTSAMFTNYSEITPVGHPSLPVIESTGATAGRINSFNSAPIGGPLPLPTGTYTIGTARFVANVAPNDGADVFVGLFNTNADGVLDNLNVLIPESSLVFGSATVNSMIPEPSTGLLVVAGLLGLVYRQRRRGRAA